MPWSFSPKRSELVFSVSRITVFTILGSETVCAHLPFYQQSHTSKWALGKEGMAIGRESVFQLAVL